MLHWHRASKVCFLRCSRHWECEQQAEGRWVCAVRASPLSRPLSLQPCQRSEPVSVLQLLLLVFFEDGLSPSRRHAVPHALCVELQLFPQLRVWPLLQWQVELLLLRGVALPLLLFLLNEEGKKVKKLLSRQMTWEYTRLLRSSFPLPLLLGGFVLLVRYAVALLPSP